MYLTQEADPQHLDFHRVTLARRAGGKVGVHPGEMRRAPDQSRGRVHADAVGRAAGVADDNLAQDIGHVAAGFIDRRFVKLGAHAFGGFLANDAVPERGVGSIAIGSVVAVDQIGHRAVFGEASKCHQ